MKLSGAASKEITQVAAQIENRPTGTKASSFTDGVPTDAAVPKANWPEVCKAAAEIKHRLDSRPGFAVPHGLPIDIMPEDTAVEIYWLPGR